MKLYVVPSEDIQFNDVFYLSGVDFEVYDKNHDGILVPPIDNCFLFLSLKNNIFWMDDSKFENWINVLFKSNSFLIINQTMDSYIHINVLSDEKIKLLNQYSNRVLIYYTGIIEKSNLKRYLNLNLVQRQYSEFFTQVNYFYNKSLPSVERTNNFLLTTIIRETRPHRNILINELNSKKLLDNFNGIVRNGASGSGHWAANGFDTSDWAGDISFPAHNIPGFKISWDLYNRSSFEIVPETLFQKCTFITEKTIKPIVARIPFLVLSNTNFYKDLKKMGFKTFDSLIDESFANYDNVHDRAQGLANTAQDILKNGGLNFYNAAQEICDFNFDHYLYMSNKDEYRSYINLLNYEKYIIDAQDK